TATTGAPPAVRARTTPRPEKAAGRGTDAAGAGGRPGKTAGATAPAGSACADHGRATTRQSWCQYPAAANPPDPSMYQRCHAAGQLQLSGQQNLRLVGPGVRRDDTRSALQESGLAEGLYGFLRVPGFSGRLCRRTKDLHPRGLPRTGTANALAGSGSLERALESAGCSRRTDAGPRAAGNYPSSRTAAVGAARSS